MGAWVPPGPRSLIPGRLIVQFARNRLGFLGRAARHGDVVGFTFGFTRAVLLNHPDHVRDVLITEQRLFQKGIGLERARILLGNGLLTSEGAHHLRQRRLMQPAFHREQVSRYALSMIAAADRRCATWSDSAEIDIAREMAALTLTIAGETLFGANVEEQAADIRSALADVLDAFTVALLPFGHLLVHTPTPRAMRFRRARARLDGIVYGLIDERRRNRRDDGDLLSTLLDVRDTEGDGGAMSDRDLRDELLTMLLAGHETTANALTWAWYVLSQHPQVQDRVHEEAAAVDALDHATHLPFTRAVVAETLRLYPPAYLLGRRSIAPYRVRGTEYVLPAGALVFLSPYLLHRDRRFWTAPEAFTPERWLASAGTGAAEPFAKYAYVPFGAGTRICIGEHFAWMEAMLVLATIARRWELRLVSGQRVEPKPIVTLGVRGGLRMTCHRRPTDGRAAGT